MNAIATAWCIAKRPAEANETGFSLIASVDWRDDADFRDLGQGVGAGRHDGLADLDAFAVDFHEVAVAHADPHGLLRGNITLDERNDITDVGIFHEALDQDGHDV